MAHSVAPAPSRRALRQRSRRQGTARPTLAQLAVAAALAVAAVVGLVWLGNVSAEPSPSNANVVTRANVRGEATAPVTIEEWADFQCPACRVFALGAERELLASYVARGQVRFVYRHFAFLGAESFAAAEAAECAGEQDRFFDFHDRLFAAQAGENRGAFARSSLKRIADSLGLSSGFGACVDSGRYAQRVRDDVAAGQAKGVNATPTLFINGQKVQGAASFEQLKAIIDPLLAGR